MQIVFLGTSCMFPTKERSHSSVFLSYDNEGILIDCGEGTQRQMKISGINLNKITKILISHWHGDHVLGLAGIIQSLNVLEYEKKLEIYGPKGTKKNVKRLLSSFIFKNNLKMKIKDLTKEGFFFESKKFKLESYNLDHGVPCLGFSLVENDKLKINMDEIKKKKIPFGPLIGELQEGKPVFFNGKKINPEEVSYSVKGKKVSFISDTALCKECYKLANDADILVCESSYSSTLENKSEEYKHLTSKQAALIASKANAKKLVLTHFSNRYKDTQELEDDARDYYDNVICAKDFMKINL